MTKPTEAKTTAWNNTGWVAKQVQFDFEGRVVVAIQTRHLSGEPLEIYIVNDGLEMFLGYFGAVAIKNPALAMAAVEALAFDAGLGGSAGVRSMSR